MISFTRNRNWSLVLVTVAFIVQNLKAISVDEFVTLNSEQKTKLDKLKDVLSKSTVTHDYMKGDVYLLRFLRYNNFDLPKTERMIKKSWAWRDKERTDAVLKEKFPDFDTEYKLHLEGCDREGKPVFSINLGDFDLRRDVLSGKSERLKRFMDKFFEQINDYTYKMLDAGENATQIYILFDMANFNLQQHACGPCIPIYLHALFGFDLHYQGLSHKLISVNTPQYAFPIWELYKPMVGERTKEVIEIYGPNKKEWQKRLLRDIDPNSLSKTFGGNNFAAIDMEFLIKTDKVFKCRDLQDLLDQQFEHSIS